MTQATITITDTDRAVLREDGDIEILNRHGDLRYILPIKAKDPGEILARARKAGETAQLDVLSDAICQLSEVRDELEDQVGKGNAEAVKLFETIRKFNAALETEKARSVVLDEDYHRTLRRAQDAERRLRAVEEILLELEGNLTPTKNLRKLDPKELRKELRKVHATLIPMRQNMINGPI